jgi:hypothetical protein
MMEVLFRRYSDRSVSFAERLWKYSSPCTIKQYFIRLTIFIMIWWSNIPSVMNGCLTAEVQLEHDASEHRSRISLISM